MIGIIGGTGLEKIELFQNPKLVNGKNKYGSPSSDIVVGELHGKSVAILSRHGREHTITPGNVNNRANITALKELGCENIIATTACGSLQENVKPGDFVILDQFIDFTKRRITTFYDEFEPGKMQHCPMAEPFEDKLRSHMYGTATALNLSAHSKGTVVTIEGPRFSSKAESFMFQNWGADVINMSTAPEVILANEAGLNYAAVAIVTDYDCWKANEESVSIELVLKNFNKSVNNVLKLISESIKTF